MHNNKYTLKSTPLATHIILFEYQSVETSTEIISIKKHFNRLLSPHVQK